MSSKEHGPAIVVADRGWVFVGEVTTDVESTDELGFVHIKGARCVRRWGTTEGLGELAQKGPRPNTPSWTRPPTSASRRAR